MAENIRGIMQRANSNATCRFVYVAFELAKCVFFIDPSM
jgi:hypothetical protein